MLGIGIGCSEKQSTRTAKSTAEFWRFWRYRVEPRRTSLVLLDWLHALKSSDFWLYLCNFTRYFLNSYLVWHVRLKSYNFILPNYFLMKHRFSLIMNIIEQEFFFVILALKSSDSWLYLCNFTRYFLNSYLVWHVRLKSWSFILLNYFWRKHRLSCVMNINRIWIVKIFFLYALKSSEF